MVTATRGLYAKVAIDGNITLRLRLHCTGTVFVLYNFVTDQVRLHCTGSFWFLAKSMHTAGIALHAGKEVRSEEMFV